MIYIHKPGHPFANEHGMIDKETYYSYRHLTEPDDDKRAVIGNQRVEINFISDGMGYTRHMADNKYYDSKSAFRKATKRAGCIEVGNETTYLTKPRKTIQPSRRERREDIKKSLYDIRNGKNTFKDTPYENVFKKK